VDGFAILVKKRQRRSEKQSTLLNIFFENWRSRREGKQHVAFSWLFSFGEEARGTRHDCTESGFWYF
jgi:hypothetical protein